MQTTRELITDIYGKLTGVTVDGDGHTTTITFPQHTDTGHYHQVIATFDRAGRPTTGHWKVITAVHQGGAVRFNTQEELGGRDNRKTDHIFRWLNWATNDVKKYQADRQEKLAVLRAGTLTPLDAQAAVAATPEDYAQTAQDAALDHVKMQLAEVRLDLAKINSENFRLVSARDSTNAELDTVVAERNKAWADVTSLRNQVADMRALIDGATQTATTPQQTLAAARTAMRAVASLGELVSVAADVVPDSDQELADTFVDHIDNVLAGILTGDKNN